MLDKVVHAIDTAGLWVAHNPRTSLVIFICGMLLVAVVF